MNKCLLCEVEKDYPEDACYECIIAICNEYRALRKEYRDAQPVDKYRFFFGELIDAPPSKNGRPLEA